MSKGWFITFEGLDKSGKTTQINLFCDYLRSIDIPFLFTREPGGNPVSERIRDLLLDPDNNMHPMCEALLYAAARSELVQTILAPALVSGQNVVCDRYVDSSVAYQGFGRSLGLETVRAVNAFATGGLMPDLTYYLSISPLDAMGRAEGPLDRMEGADMDFHERVRHGYETLCAAEPKRFCAIDASASIDEVQKAIRNAFEARFLP